MARRTGEPVTVTYPPYTGAKLTCPKCGESITDKWMPAGTVFIAASFDGGCTFRYGTGPEWLYRECSQCNYGWPEQPRDTAAEAVTPAPRDRWVGASPGGNVTPAGQALEQLDAVKAVLVTIDALAERARPDVAAGLRQARALLDEALLVTLTLPCPEVGPDGP